MKAVESYRRLLRNVQLVFLLGMAGLTTYFVTHSYHQQLAQSEKHVQEKLASAARTAAHYIDGDQHQDLMLAYRSKDAINQADQPQAYRSIHRTLLEIHQVYDLTSPLYTLVLDSTVLLNSRPRFEFGVTSLGMPHFRHAYTNYPQALLEQYATGGRLDQYKDEHGNWISAFAPIRNRIGETVAVVQADLPFDDFIAAARQELLYNVLISVAIALLLWALMNRFMKRVLSQQEITRQLADSLQEAKEARARAEKASRAKAEFLSNMSHEIRTPLNAVVGLSHHLMEGETTEEQQESLRVLNFSANNLMMLVNDILDFSKIEAGKVEFEHVEFDLEELTSSIMHSHELSAQQKGIELEYCPTADLPRRLVGDPTRIGQVLNNLVSNAVKFTEKGWVHLTVDTREVTDTHAELHFAVSDSGIGISPEKHAEIFQNFSQAEGNTTRKFGGTGLGLAITKRLTELMGSEIQLESTVGEGSTFRFSLTLELAQQQEETVSEPLDSDQEQQLQGYKVLVAEDNEINTFVLQKFLEKWGLEAEFAVNGRQACDMVDQGGFDLVLMDLQMPEMDGYEATRQIRAKGTKEFSNLPIVALTASAMIEIQDRAYAVGMNDYVSKPFNPEELFQKIAKYTRGKAA